jgi:hypothetical protein
MLPERPQTRLAGGGVLTDAWRLMADNYVLLLSVAAVAVGITVASAVVSFGLEKAHAALSISWDLLTYILIDAPLLTGITLMGLRLARGERPALDAMFDGFRAYGPVVLINFITSLIVVLGLAAVFLPFGGLIGLAALGGGRPPVLLFTLGFGIAMLLGLGVYLFLTARLFLADVLYLDQTGPRPDLMDAIKLSWRITGPVTLTLVLLGLLASFIALGTMLMLVIGLILLGMPLLVAMFGITARRMIESLDRPVCNHCGFDTSAGTQPRCPECGRSPWRYTRVGV